VHRNPDKKSRLGAQQIFKFVQQVAPSSLPPFPLRRSNMISEETVRILYMEDDAGLARLFQRRLRKAGYEVDIAPDGE
jgi:hypothetical protein